MATIKEIEQGAVNFIDNEIAPKIPTNVPNGQIKKIAVIAGATYALRRNMEKLIGNPMIAAIGAVDAEGNVDVEGIAEMFKQQIPEKGFKVTVPILGDLTFFEDDVTKLVTYITGK